MSYGFYHLHIEHRVTREAFSHRTYAKSVAEAMALARLTFAAAMWEILPNPFDDIFERIAPAPIQPIQTTPTASIQTTLF